MMHYFNRTFFDDDSTQWRWISFLFHLDILLIGLNTLHTVFFLWINIKSHQFHKNWTGVMNIIYIQHIITSLASIVQKVLQTQNKYFEHSIAFHVTSYVRVFCIYVGLSVLPTLVIERYFATVLFLEYESKPRNDVMSFLVGLLLAIGTVNAYTIHRYKTSLYNVSFLLLINSLGVIGNIILLRINKKRHRESVQSSLAARYQLAENIKACQLVNRIVLSMGSFNAAVCFILFLDNFELSVHSRILTIFASDVTGLTYSTVFPYVYMHYCERLGAVFEEYFKKILHRPRITPYTVSSGEKRPNVVLHNTLGKVMTDASTEAYFRQIEASWNA